MSEVIGPSMLKYIENRYHNQRGVALIAALLVTAILLTLVTDFIYRMYIASSRAGILKDSVRAGALASDGIVLAKAGLEQLGHTTVEPFDEIGKAVFPQHTADLIEAPQVLAGMYQAHCGVLVRCKPAGG